MQFVMRASRGWRALVLSAILVCSLADPGLVLAAPDATWKQLLDKADKLEKSKLPALRRQAAVMLMKAYKMAPRHRRSINAAALSCLLQAMLSRKGRDMMLWGQRGVVFAKQLIKRWPQEAEGYFWASVHFGQIARGGGVWVAITKGLAGKIERNAIASFRRDFMLHKGAAQRILGRYYYRLPWPMRRLKKSLMYLENAYKHFPTHTGNQFYLAETLWALGKKDRAIRLYRKCAKARHAKTHHAHTGIKCDKWLRKHKK